MDARAIQDRLDEVLGVEGWQDDYECLPDGSVVCRLRLRLGDEWVTKVDVGGLYETNGRGWVVQPTAAEVKKFFKPGDWNTMIVSAQGPKLRVEVNGVKTAEITDPKGRTRGKIALQVHGGQEVLVMFKEVRIQGEPIKDK